MAQQFSTDQTTMTFTDYASIVQLYETLHTAIRHDTPLNILYATGGDIVKTRTIRPLDITVGTKGSDLVHAHDSIRDSILTFRVDRIVAYGQVTA